MNRRNFLSLTGTFTGGLLVLPDFLHALGTQPLQNQKDSCVVFIQLNGGNDGLNTYIPFDHPGYYDLRPHIAIAKNDIIGKNNGMGWHPALKNWNTIQ
ncbi:MAG: Twin-arginine translocation pathway signal sequence domain protein precursor, partial [Flavobacterium sp.]